MEYSPVKRILGCVFQLFQAMPLLSFLGLMDVEFSASLLHGFALRGVVKMGGRYDRQQAMAF